jgi:hypothetical protein
MSNPRDLLRSYKAPPPLAVPMQTEVRSDGGMKLHMLRAPLWSVNPGAKFILRWSGSLSLQPPPTPFPALWQLLVMPDSAGKSAERLINEWITNLSVPGYYLGTFVTKPQTPHGSYGSTAEVQALFTTQGDPARLLTEINLATGSPGPLKDLLTTYCPTPDSNPWAVQNLWFGGPGVACILGWSGMLNSPADLDALKQYLGTNTSAGSLPENLINAALAVDKLDVGYYLGTFVTSATFPANVQVLFGLNSTLRSDDALGNPNNLTDDEYNLGKILQNMSYTAHPIADAWAALSGLLQIIGSSIHIPPGPPWFMLSQMDIRVIDPNAP